MIINMFREMEKEVRRIYLGENNKERSWSECRPGDVIRVKRKIPYMHYAIYVGNGKVIHRAGLKKDFSLIDDIHVHESDFSDFLLYAEYYEIVSYKGSYSPDEIVKRAYECIDRRGYSLLFNNCEHFAVYCATGEKRSQQVENFIEKGTIMVHIAVIAVTTAVPATRPLRFLI